MDDKPPVEQPSEVTTLPNGIVFDPEQHRILKNSTVQDKKTGQFLSPPAPEHAPITASNAQALVKKRWEDSRNAFANGVAEGIVGKDAAPVDAWQAVGKRAGELLKATESVRGFADLARFTGESAGFVPMARGREEMQEPSGEQNVIMIWIGQYIQQLQTPADTDVIDGR